MAGSRGRAMASVALLLAEVLLLLGRPGAAHAHADLVASTPRAGDMVSQAADGLVLVFAEGVLPGSAQVVVRGPDGGDVVGGAPEVDGSTVRVPVALAAAGPHAVTYRVTSGDGHPVVGRYSFRVASDAAAHAPTGGGAATDTLTVAAAASDVDDEPATPQGGGTPWWAGAALVLLAALVAVRRAGRRTAKVTSGDGEHLSP